jgi:hypothetical protein
MGVLMRRLTVALVLIAACGGDDNGSGPISIDDLGATEINLICDLYVRCGVFPDDQACRDAFNFDFSNEAALIAAVKAGKVQYDGNKARECLNELIGTTCDRRQFFGTRNQPLACSETFMGTVGDAGMCAMDEECISQDCVLPTCPVDQCCAGMCMGAAAPVRSDIGGACQSTSDCLHGYCDATLTCAAFLADGAACTSSTACDSDFCNQTCQPLVASGAACTSAQECQNLGETCRSDTMTCGQGAPLNATCTGVSDCASLLYCDPTAHVCMARPKVGESCATIGSCADSSYCDMTSKLCTARKADGAMCQSQTECTSDRCDTTTTHVCYTPPVCI